MNMLFGPSIRRLLIWAVLFACLAIAAGAQGPAPNKPDATRVKVSPAMLPTLAVPVGYSSDVKVNYVRTREGLGPVKDEVIFDSAGYGRVRESTQYLDGLGRVFQTVSREAEAAENPGDIVSPVRYDEYGREVYQYLPYVQTGANRSDGSFKPSPYSGQDTFYRNIYRDGDNNVMYGGEDFFYSKTAYEPSPLNRVTLSLAAGNSWVGSNRGKEQEYRVNTEEDKVRVWEIANEALRYSDSSQDANVNIPVSAGVYQRGQLVKNVTRSEEGNLRVEYSDKRGLVVLRKVQVEDLAVNMSHSGLDQWLWTYYVYDDLDQVRFVIPPKAVEGVKMSWTLTADIVNELCFRYEYDERGRMIARKVPGAGWVYMVYDRRDRLVFVQDANLRTRHKWMATLYDALNRPVITGMESSDLGREELQRHVNGVADSVGRQVVDHIGNRESYSVIEVMMNPLVVGESFIPLTVTYYDDYSWTDKTYTGAYNVKLEDGGSNAYPEDLLDEGEQQKVSTLGAVTGKLVRVLEDESRLSGSKWMTTVMFYDQKGRVIQRVSGNYKGGTDIVTNRYDFTGNLICDYLVHNNPGAAGGAQRVSVKTMRNYDHGGRLLELWKSVNDEEDKRVRIVANGYDELGRLRTKKLGERRKDDGTFSGAALETLNYNYNIRGWLKGINASYVHPELVGSERKDNWFGEELNYDWGSMDQGNNRYGGNISSVSWRSRGDGVRRAYGFSYDKADRLLGADFSENNKGGGYGDDGQVNFDVMMGDGKTPGSAYDENGNIKGMKQWGLLGTHSDVIDELEYTYFKNSNKVKGVRERNHAAQEFHLGDFSGKGGGLNDYGYDRNGNLVTDLNRNIQGAQGLDQQGGGGIEYNFLNLPSNIKVGGGVDKDSGGVITYLYDVLGNKLEKEVLERDGNADSAKVTSYIEGMVYEQGVLQYIGHEEGRIRVKTVGDQTTYNYDYFIRDHLGSVRMVLTDEIRAADIYQATMEDNHSQTEAAQFGEKIKSTRTDKSVYPGFDDDRGNTKISVVNGSSEQSAIGPGVVLKVMSGDRIRARAFGWYQVGGGNTGADVTPGKLASTLLQQLVSGLAGTGKAISSGPGNDPLEIGLLNFLNSRSGSSQARPKAYLNWILLDEQRLQVAASGFVQVPEMHQGQGKEALFANNGDDIAITKNGYIYVYVSNESSQDVYFDDIRVEHARGPLLEETHYYPFGLTMAGISSKAAGGVENRKKYNGIEFDNDLDINTYEAYYRNLDPQTGRWWQIDPKVDAGMESVSPYASMYDDPISYSDPLGDEPDGDGPGVGSVSWNFVKGVGQSVWGTVEGVGTAIAHPIETAEGIGHAAAHPIETAKAIGNAVSETYSDFKNGNGDVKANILGKVVGEIGQVLVGAEAVKAGTNLVRGAKITEEAAAVTKTAVSPNVQKVLNTLNEIKAEGGTVKPSVLKSNQELNLTIQKGNTKMDFRIETGKVSPKYGGNGVTPQRHMNVDLFKDGRKLKNALPNNGHRVLE